MTDFDFDIIRRSWPLLRDATVVSIELFAISLVLATAIGLVVALMRMSKLAPLRWFAAIYVWIFRGLPALVILFFAFFWLGNTLGLTPFQSAILGLSVSSGAYKAEIIRAGLLTVDRGQYEASEALGFNINKKFSPAPVPENSWRLYLTISNRAFTLEHVEKKPFRLKKNIRFG